MTLKHKILILLLAWALNINAQDKLTKTKSLGLGFSFSAAFNIPLISQTPYLFLKSNRHEVFVGLDFYFFPRKTGNIHGLQGGYKYYFRDPNKIFNAYLTCNIQYVQFGQGLIWAVPYNYSSTIDYEKDYNLIRTRSFSNTYGLGFSLSFLKRFTSLMEVSGGYNYSQATFSPTNINNQIMSNLKPGTKIIFTPFIKIGLGFKIYKWQKRVQIRKT